MHRPVSRVSGLALVGSAAVLGCRSEPVAAIGASAAGSASSAPVFDAGRFDPAARAVVDAALAYAETCNLKAEEPTGWFDFITYDVCSNEAKDLDPAIAAGKSLEQTTAGMRALPLPARAVAEEARIFVEFVEGVAKIHVSRGTMRLYQDLALAWNAYKPDAKAPTEPKHALDQYFVAYPERGVAYIWEQTGCYDEKTVEWVGCDPVHPYVRLDRYGVHRKRGTPLPWRSSPQGPFLAN